MDVTLSHSAGAGKGESGTEPERKEVVVCERERERRESPLGPAVAMEWKGQAGTHKSKHSICDRRAVCPWASYINSLSIGKMGYQGCYDQMGGVGWSWVEGAINGKLELEMGREYSHPRASPAEGTGA